MILQDTVIKAVQSHAVVEYPRECCGLVVKRMGLQLYVPCRNVAEGNSQFVIDPEDWIAAEETGEIVAICHSHPDQPPDPTPADRAACEATQLPWFVVSFPDFKWASVFPSGYNG